MTTANAANSNICHIEAAEEGGQRHNRDMTDKERADYPNLILLCPSHHKVTDNVTVYTVEKLKAMKSEHEAAVRRRVSATRPLNSRPSLLAEMIKHIAAVEIDTVIIDSTGEAFGIEAKITHNQVVRCKHIIQEHAIYSGKLQKIYSEFEKGGSGRVNDVMRNISKLYAKKKGEILGADTTLANLQRHADDLIEGVERGLHDLIDQSPNGDAKISYEVADFALTIILVDAFMRCKILEEPT